jgi:hypothetical protein
LEELAGGFALGSPDIPEASPGLGGVASLSVLAVWAECQLTCQQLSPFLGVTGSHPMPEGGCWLRPSLNMGFWLDILCPSYGCHPEPVLEHSLWAPLGPTWPHMCLSFSHAGQGHYGCHFTDEKQAQHQVECSPAAKSFFFFFSTGV